jgi:hypothetical protein
MPALLCQECVHQMRKTSRETAMRRYKLHSADRQPRIKTGSNDQTDSHVSRQAATIRQTATYQDRQQQADRQSRIKTGSNEQTDSQIEKDRQVKRS